MSNAVPVTTKTTGYYNPARWPIQLVISKLNITLTLEPGKFILDRQGRRVNDPYFDVFVQNRQLQREISDMDVPLIMIPVVTPVATDARTSPVQVIAKWKHDGGTPVIPAPAAAPASARVVVPATTAHTVPANSSSIRTMTMDEAYRQGLAKRSRIIPEDYGAVETTGMPPRGIPPMKYSIDPTVNKAPAPLPGGLLEVEGDASDPAARRLLISGLGSANQKPLAEDNIPGVHTPAPKSAGQPDPAPVAGNDSLLMSGTGIPPAPVQTAAQEVPTTEVPVEEPPRDEAEAPADSALPPPVLESPAPTASEVATTTTQAPPAAVTPRAARQPTADSRQFVCPVCGEKKPLRNVLLAHVRQKHPEQVAAVSAMYA